MITMLVVKTEGKMEDPRNISSKLHASLVLLFLSLAESVNLSIFTN